MVEVGCSEEHLQVANHVEEDETHHRDSRDGHDVLLANGR